MNALRKRLAQLEQRTARVELLQGEARRLDTDAAVALQRGDLLTWLKRRVAAAGWRLAACELLGHRSMTEAQAAGLVEGLGLTRGQVDLVLDALEGRAS